MPRVRRECGLATHVSGAARSPACVLHLILDDGNLFAMIRGEDVVEQCRLSTAEEASENRHRHEAIIALSHSRIQSRCRCPPLVPWGIDFSENTQQ